MSDVMEQIPLVNLAAQYHDIKKEIDASLQSILSSSDFILGDRLAKFEKKFSHYTQTRYAVGVGSGLSALELGLSALGIGKGDEVITPVNSFVASSFAITSVGATPIWVDCDARTYNIDTTKIEQEITKKTKAIMPVHLYGQSAEMDKILSLARKYHLLVVEDACQAHGAMYKNRKVGSIGDIGAFSFYPGKNLGAYGDGGIIVTNKSNIAQQIRLSRSYGEKSKYHSVTLGGNSRLDALQATVLNVKLKYLEAWNKKRRKNALHYTNLLRNTSIIVPEVSKNSLHAFHLFVIRTKHRNKLYNYLRSNGVFAGIHYPVPIHLQKAYRDAGCKKGDFPVAERVSNEIISLPLYPELKKQEIEYVVKLVKDVVGNSKKAVSSFY